MKPSFLNKLFKRNEPKAFVGQPDGNWDSLGTIPFGALHTMKHYGNDNYENGYSAIQFIAKRFMKIRPYAIDNNGKPLDNQNVINVLSRPEQNMSGVQFRKTLAVMSLVHNKVYVLVWERRGREAIPATENIREDTIAGFTILEGVQEEVFDGKIQYRVMWGNEQRVFTKQQVMSFYDVNPSDLGRGYSPAKAAKRWTRIDDYIADYQTGFFENGAVPAGMFIITAPTQKDYNDIVDNMEQHHKGAGKNNNVMYSYQAIDPSTGKPTQASVTWVPFNVDNKNLDLKTLFEQANSKIDAAYGVSAFLRGADDSAPNRSVAQTIERGFVENVLEPFVIEFWARFQHELNRITGGLGYGIAYNVEIPNISEDEESEARTRTLNVSALTTLTTFGYTLDSAIDALQLPNNWKLLKQGTSAVTKIKNDKEDVDDGGEVEAAPDNPQIKAQACEHDHPKAPKALTEDEQLFNAAELEVPARELLEAQIDRAIANLPQDGVEASVKAQDGEYGEPTDDDEQKFLDDMMVIIASILLVRGIQQWEDGKLLLTGAGFSTAGLPAYSPTTDALGRYRAYLKTVFDSYSKDTTEAIRAVLLRSRTEVMTRAETEGLLRGLMQTDEWRVKRIGVSEANKSGSQASVEAMRKIAEDTGATVEKTLQSSTGSPCKFCQTLIGVWKPVDDLIVKKGATLTAEDGSIFVNNWDNNEGHDPHANGKCTPIYRVVS